MNLPPLPAGGPRIALVTGASRETGLGREIARQLGQAGFHVLLTARHLAAAEEHARALRDEGLDVVARALDVTDDASIASLRDQVATTYGHLDILINNAGSYYDAGAEAISSDLTYAHDALELNLFGAWRMTQAFVPLLEKSAHPRIVNVGSAAGSFGDPVLGLDAHPQGVASYAISKAALHALTIKLARELKPRRILVNVICPGFVASHPGLEKFGARPVPDGARCIVWGALLPDDGPTGGFFRDGRPLPW